MRRRRGGMDCHLMALICIAFGGGLILAIFCSLKFVVVLAAIFLIILGLVSAC